MKSVTSSIGVLVKQADKLHEALVEHGYEAHYDIHTSGHISDVPSYIQLSASKDNDVFFHLKLHANGKGRIVSMREIKRIAMFAIKNGKGFSFC